MTACANVVYHPWEGKLTYQLWSHGRLLGESPLDFVRCFPRLRTGELQTTALGRSLLARMTDTRSDALFAARKLHRERSHVDTEAQTDTSLLYTTIMANMVAANDYREALQLELRRPDGSIVPTERIDLNDTEFLISFGALHDEDADAADSDASPGDDVHVSFDPETDVDAPDEDDDLFEDLDPFGLAVDGWTPDPIRTFPRFQLMVWLLQEADLP